MSWWLHTNSILWLTCAVCGLLFYRLIVKVLLEQGDPQSRVFLITQGSVSRLRYLNEQLHQVETVGGENHRYVCTLCSVCSCDSVGRDVREVTRQGQRASTVFRLTIKQVQIVETLWWGKSLGFFRARNVSDHDSTSRCGPRIYDSL